MRTAAWLLAVVFAQTPTEPPAGEGAGALTEVPTVVKLRALAASPYRIRVWLTFERHPRMTAALAAAVQQAIRSGADDHLAGAWNLDFGAPPQGDAISPAAPLEDLPDPQKLGANVKDLDKILWVEVGVDAERVAVPPFFVAVREYDFEFKSWGPSVRRTIDPDDSLPNSAFALMHRQFRANIAVLGMEEDRRKVRIVVRGLPLQPPDSAYPLLRIGTPLKLIRDVLRKGKLQLRADIPWTYLIFRSADADRRTGVCSLMSSLSNPIDTGTLRKSKIMGLAASTSEDASTEVSFVARQRAVKEGADAGKRPLPGYEVLLRIQDQQLPVAVGNTDRRGRIILRPAELGFDPANDGRPRVCEVTLRIGNLPIASFPLAPGDEIRREVTVSPDPLLPEISGKMQALNNELIDALARQALLVKRKDTILAKINALRATEVDPPPAMVAELRQVVETANKLPKNEYFQKKLDAVKQEAQQRSEKEFKTKSFSSHVKKLFAGIEKQLKERQIGVELQINVPGLPTAAPGSTENAPPVK